MTLSQPWRDRLGITAVASVILAACIFVAAVAFIAVKFNDVAASDAGQAKANHHLQAENAAGVQTLRNDAVYLYLRLNQICARVDCGVSPPLPKQVRPPKN